jgi:hypothetical protein
MLLKICRCGAKFKKIERAGLHVMLLLFCRFALKKDERKVQYSKSNIPSDSFEIFSWQHRWHDTRNFQN